MISTFVALVLFIPLSYSRPLQPFFPFFVRGGCQSWFPLFVSGGVGIVVWNFPPPPSKKEKVSTKTSHWRKPVQLRTKSIWDGFWKILRVLKSGCRSYTWIWLCIVCVGVLSYVLNPRGANRKDATTTAYLSYGKECPRNT